jgi:hypothetical protein
MLRLGQSVRGANDYGPKWDTESTSAESTNRAATALITLRWSSRYCDHPRDNLKT